MIVLIVDTETSGLPQKKNASIYQTELWPYIVQLSFIVYDIESHSILHSYDQIIYVPPHVKIHPAAIKVHGIDSNIIQKKGIPIEQALIHLNQWAAQSELIVGHNISFDKRMLYVEFIRNKIHGFGDRIKPVFYCTMKKGASICNIIAKSESGDSYIKYPKLSELYQHLVKQSPNGLHNAFCDVLICLRCFCIMEGYDDPCRVSPAVRDMYVSFAI